MMSGDVSRARSTALRESSASPTISKSGSRSRMFGDRRPGTGRGRRRSGSGSSRRASGGPGRPADARARRIPSRSSALLCSRRAPVGIASRTTVPPSGRDRTSKRAPISSARSRMNCSPKLRRPRAATAPTSKPRPSSRTSRTQSSSSTAVVTTTVGRRGVLADILQGLLRDAQHDRPLGGRRARRPGGQVGRDRRPPVACATRVDRSSMAPSRPSSSSTGGRSWLMNVAHVAQLAAEQLAQECAARPRPGRVRLERRAPCTRPGRSRSSGPGPARRGSPGRAATARPPGPRRSASRRQPRPAGRAPSVTSDASPRSRNSQVRSRVRSASSSLAELAPGGAELARRALDLAAQGAQRARRRRPRRLGRVGILASPRRPSHGRRSRGARRSAVELVAEVLPARERLGVGLA